YTRAAPSSRAMRRKGKSVTPAIGAMTTGCSSRMPPMVGTARPPPLGASSSSSRSGLLAVLAAEPLHPAARGHDALLPLAGVEGMALGADLHPQVLDRRTRLEGFPAGARHRGAVVRRVNAFLHRPFTSHLRCGQPPVRRPGRHSHIIAHAGRICRTCCSPACPRRERSLRKGTLAPA